MPEIEEDEDDDVEDDELIIFPLTDLSNDSGNSSDAERDTEEDDVCSPDTKKSTGPRFRPLMTLKQRRRSLLSASSVPIQIPNRPTGFGNDGPFLQDSGISGSPMDRWKRALRQVHTMSDPWAKFKMESLPTERAKRYRYSALKKKWVTDEVSVKMENEPFNHGAMRECYRLKKLSNRVHSSDWSQQSHNYVAKSYMEDVGRDVYFEDVHLQMDAKLWGEEYNRHNPPKKVDVLQISVLEFTDRPGSPLFHLEHFIDGQYIKYNSNSGFVEESLRLTPQAFSHFSFERSGHQLIIVDVQGVGDLWTDPQIHTAVGDVYGDANLGTRGMALFFHSHVCNEICASLALSKFDLAPSEQRTQDEFIRMQRNAETQLRGVEEICGSISPTDAADLSLLLAHRLRTTSAISSGCGDDELTEEGDAVVDDDDEANDDCCISPTSPLDQRERPFLSASDDSLASTMTDEEERARFHVSARINSRPSCVANEIDLRSLQSQLRLGSSTLGQVHHDLAKYHEMGRFILPGLDDAPDLQAALFHEQQAAELGVKEAIVTMANIHLQRSQDVLASITVDASPENEEIGVVFMERAANAGDRSAMIYLAKAYESGNGLGINRERSYADAVDWYEAVVNTTSEDDGGEFDAAMDDPVYQLQAAMAQLYLIGGYGLEKDPSYAGELYTSAGEGATMAMKGRLASKYFALAEEAWAQCE